MDIRALHWTSTAGLLPVLDIRALQATGATAGLGDMFAQGEGGAERQQEQEQEEGGGEVGSCTETVLCISVWWHTLQL